MTLTSLILLTYNNLHYTRQCLDSILVHTPLNQIEIIVVDNASQDDTPHYLQKLAGVYPQIHPILNATNLGFSAGINLGAANARGEYLVFLNNDVIVTEGWLSGLLAHLQDPAVGVVGPVTNSSGNESRIAVDYTDLAEMPAFAARYTQEHAGQTFEIDMLPFQCVALRRAVFEQIGPLDERFGIGMFEDDDYALRLKEKGYRILCAEDVFIHHFGSASFSTLERVTFRQLFEENRKKFEQKWNRPWQPHLYRKELLHGQINELMLTAVWHEQEIALRNDRIAERDQTIAELQSRVAEREQTIAELQSHVAERDQTIAELQSHVAERDLSIDQFKEEISRINQKNNELNRRLYIAENSLREIQTSTTWRATEKIRHMIAPPGSNWEQTLRRLSTRLQARSQAQSKQIKPMISWESYFFHRYKQTRQTFTTERLDGLQPPSIPGRVSIVLPVYNGEDYLREALDSILAQTYHNFELIVVDDGSTDGTPQILEEYASRDGRISVIYQANQRLPSALNTGFRRARGEFLTWTSADNRLKPEFLARMVDCLQRHPEWDATYANIDIIGEDGQPLRNSYWYSGSQNPPGSEHIYMPADTSTLNVIANNTVGPAFMYRNRVDCLLGDYSPRRFGTEDYDFWMRVNALLALFHADFYDPVYEYRFHSTSLTALDEELGITRSRDVLMVFEDARRDFYNSPLACLINSDGSPEAQEVADQLRLIAHQAGCVLLDAATADWQRSHSLWFPLAALMVTSDAANAIPPQTWPAQACPILISVGNAHLPAFADPAWHMCFTLNPHLFTPRLAKPRQGWLSITNLDTLFTAIDIRVKSLQLEQLEAEIASPSQPECKITVVISTYHRGPQLEEAIRSVLLQTFQPTDYEIVVVNNDPADSWVEKIVSGLRQSSFADQANRLRLIECHFEGLSHARNAGISAARGELICFLDDDAVAFPDWLSQIWQAYQENPQAGVLGGTILLDPPSPRPRWAKPGWERYWSALIPERSETYKAESWWDYPWGANWSGTRRALLGIGGFRTRYGRRGTDYSGGEEVIAASLVERLGYTVHKVPAAKVYHRPQPSRYSLRHVANTLKGQWLSGYRQQIDLYLPDKPDLPSLKHYKNEHLRKAFLASGLPLYRRLESYYLAQAFSVVIQEYQADLQARVQLKKTQETISSPLASVQTHPIDNYARQRLDQEFKAILAMNEEAKGVVIFVPTITWKTKLFQRPQQMALAFAKKGYLTFYWERPDTELFTGEFHKINDHLYVNGKDTWDIFKQVKSPIVFTLAYNRSYLKYFDAPRVVYEYIDELNIFPYELAQMERDHQTFLRSAQVVVATAERLYQRILPVRPDAIVCPNAVDDEFIRQAIAASTTPPTEINAIIRQGRPIIGYYGALAEWFDYRLLARAAQSRPNYDFVLIGPDYEGSLTRSHIQDHPNVHWIDWKQYHELPAYLKYFDVATIPFCLNDLTNATSPLKLFEYAAARKPIVTTAMAECKKYSQVLVAHNEAEYIAYLDRALQLRKDEDYLRSLDELANQNTWALRVEAILKALVGS